MWKMRKVLPVIVLALAMLAAFPYFAAADTIPTSTTLISTFDRTFNYDYAPGTENWYKVSLKQGQGVTFRLNAHLNSGAVIMELFDAAGTEINATDTVSDTENGFIEFTAKSSAAYYIKVYSDYWNPASYGNYDLGVYRAWFDAGVSDGNRSFYSNFSEAKYLQAGNYTLSAFGEDYYRFTALQGAHLMASVQANTSSGAIELEWYDQWGNQLDITDAILNGQTKTIDRIVQATGVYYLRVVSDYWNPAPSCNYNLSFTGVTANKDSDKDGVYDAAEYIYGTNVNSADSDASGISDYNELLQGSDPRIAKEYSISSLAGATSRVTAVPLPGFNTPIKASTNGNDTWYKMNLVNGQSYTFLFASHPNAGGLYLELYDQFGNKIDGTDTTYDGDNNWIDYTASVSGVYYLKVVSDYWDSVTSGNYEITAFNGWATAGITDSSRSFYASFNTARYVKSGNYVYSPYKSDVFRLTAQKGATLSASLKANVNGGALVLELYDQLGNKIDNTSSIWDGQTQTISKSIQATGTYYLRVVQDYWENVPEGNYNIAVIGADPAPLSSGTGIWNLKSNGTNLASSLGWNSSSFTWSNSKAVTGDFNGDGKDDVAVLYNYGNNTSGLWMFISNGSTYTPKLAWKSGAGSFAWGRSKIASGDFNGDGKEDIEVLYDYGNNTSGLWTFKSNGSTFTPALAWKSGMGSYSWGASNLTCGDYNGDGKADLAVMYNYGNNTSGIWRFTSNGVSFTPQLAWKSSYGSFAWSRGKISSGDINGDKKSDIVVLYNYGYNTSGLWNFVSNGASFSPSPAWKSGTGGFSWDASKLITSDINGDGKSDAVILYNYGNKTSGVWSFLSKGTSYTPQLAWKSTGYAWDKSVVLGGDFNGDKKEDCRLFYNFSN